MHLVFIALAHLLAVSMLLAQTKGLFHARGHAEDLPGNPGLRQDVKVLYRKRQRTT